MWPVNTVCPAVSVWPSKSSRNRERRNKSGGTGGRQSRREIKRELTDYLRRSEFCPNHSCKQKRDGDKKDLNFAAINSIRKTKRGTVWKVTEKKKRYNLHVAKKKTCEMTQSASQDIWTCEEKECIGTNRYSNLHEFSIKKFPRFWCKKQTNKQKKWGWGYRSTHSGMLGWNAWA